MFLYSWPGGSWQATAVYAALIVGVYVAALWLTLIFWTARDIRQRSNSAASQLGAVMLVMFFFLPGLWLYLVVRPRYTKAQRYAQVLEEEALRLELEKDVACPNCSRAVREDFLVCPACRVELKQPCTACMKPLANAWVACPYCGLDRPKRREPTTSRPERTAPRRVPAVQVMSPAKPPAAIDHTPVAVAETPTGTAG